MKAVCVSIEKGLPVQDLLTTDGSRAENVNYDALKIVAVGSQVNDNIAENSNSRDRLLLSELGTEDVLRKEHQLADSAQPAPIRAANAKHDAVANCMRDIIEQWAAVNRLKSKFCTLSAHTK
ncbi:hypothetical protein KIN20_018575 [Parelaphostrongylus tenuis]|uniref:Uncharacterized protein n=1 Tax=Parelaphostrongylus tenuis TaxID=148309 RepID=A0AAD5N7P1_PARTN|nr:hypothetical protein KIN20_018575 [Parelaphostrongylus tenuis]